MKMGHDIKPNYNYNNDNNEEKFLQPIIKADQLMIHGGLFLKEDKGDPYSIYTVQKSLGEGAFGQVFKVIHKQTKVNRAMKVINKLKACIDEEGEDELKNEIDILKNLDHPNIIKIYEFYSSPRKLFIISELCTGGELFDKITQVKSFSEKIAAHIMRQLFSAISFCHSKNVIHRDLKPENILIDKDTDKDNDYFQIKIIDFGTSQKIKKNALLNKQIGTPFYIAPDVLNNKYNEKCDLWSAGVILFILLSGSPPFYGSTDEEIYDSVKKGEYSMDGPEWDEISEEAKDLIKKLLVKDYENRLSADQALNHKWIVNITKNNNTKPLSKENLNRIAKNINNFHSNQKLQQATLAYIVHNLTTKEEIEECRKIFLDFDEDGNGKLTREELMKGLSKVMTPTEAEIEVNRMMKLIDLDNNGCIEFEEFLQATMDKDKLITDDNLRAVFSMFDKDNSGTISIEEIKEILGGVGQISEKVWEEIINDIDKNGDGVIEFDEFKGMMGLILKTNK